MLLRKAPSPIEVYNDLDEEVVLLFRVLRDPEKAEQLRRAVYFTPWSRHEFHACWEREEGLTDVELCRRLVVRSFQAVGAKRARSRNGWRARADRISPTGAWRTWPDQIPHYVERLRTVLIEQKPAELLFPLYDSPQTAWFVDPPYMHATRAWDHRSIYHHELSVDDHVALLASLQSLSGFVLLAGYRSELYDDTLAGWRRVDIHARAQGNRPRVESMWLNPAAIAGLRQASLTLEGFA